MASRSLNKVQLIGNLTRDPELRYTPSGAAVCTVGLATNRYWTTESGERKEETEFHRLVAWNKLAELCSQLLSKGRKIFVEGRLRTNTWQGQDGNQRTTTEVIIDDMILLDSRRPAERPAQSQGQDLASDDSGQSGDDKPDQAAEEEEKEEIKKEEEIKPEDNSKDKDTKKDDSDDKEESKTAEENEKIEDDKKTEKPDQQEKTDENVNPDDIPF